MKHITYQIMSAVGALLCALAFWVATVFKAGDFVALLVITVVPAVIGCYLGWRIGMHGLTLPLYSTATMLSLAHANIRPYYSSDWHWSGPSMLYSMFLAPAALLPVLIIVVFRGIRRRKNKPAHTKQSTISSKATAFTGMVTAIRKR
jgi:hypothetical protein